MICSCTLAIDRRCSSTSTGECLGQQRQVLWRYHDKYTHEAHYVWCTGRVVRIADGLTDKRSKRAQTILKTMPELIQRYLAWQHSGGSFEVVWTLL